MRVRERTQELTEANAALQAEISDRQLAEQRLEKLASELKRSNRELEQFAYVASHDLQEPLRAITGYTQLLELEYRDNLDETALDYLNFIVDGAGRMQQLIQDLLAYSRVGTHAGEFTPVDCNAIVEQVLQNLQIAIAHDRAIVTCDPLPAVMADRTQLLQLFQNLISNAVKSDPQLRRIPVVILTTSADEQDVIRSYDLSANCYITKPVGAKQFLELVQLVNQFWLVAVKLPHA
jgi:light-regulated signal transduction histidine kinase (bacteriophytochrome)